MCEIIMYNSHADKIDEKAIQVFPMPRKLVSKYFPHRFWLFLYS